MQELKNNNYKYIMSCGNGFIKHLRATTLVGAKRLSTQELSHGCGNVTIYDDNTGEALAYRTFWQQLNNFGWNKWVNC